MPIGVRGGFSREAAQIPALASAAPLSIQGVVGVCNNHASARRAPIGVRIHEHSHYMESPGIRSGLSRNEFRAIPCNVPGSSP